MPLTDSQCRAARPKDDRYRLPDARGLSLLVLPGGARIWRHRYRLGGAGREDTLGAYPDVSLAEARTMRDSARVDIAAGRDPRGDPDPAKAAPGDRRRLLRNVAEEWFEAAKRPTLEPRTAGRQWARMSDVLKTIGDMDIGEVGPADVLRALRATEARGAVYTARRVRGMVEALFDYAHIPYGVEHNPASPRLLRSLRPVPRARNHPAMPFADLPLFYRKLRGERCLQAQDDTRTRLAVELVLHTVLRTDELRHGKWEQIGSDTWSIPAEQMKTVNGVARDHLVPLTARAQEILRELRPTARRSGLIFPGLRPGRPMSENTMGNWMKARGYQDHATIHGFRTTFSTHAHERGWNSDWIEVQLAHVDRDKVRGVYNKAIYLDGRREMLGWWAAQLAEQEALADLL